MISFWHLAGSVCMRRWHWALSAAWWGYLAAARLLAEAQTQAEAAQRKASGEIESYRHAALEALKLAARDARLQLEAAVLAAFEGHVKRLVVPVTYDGRFVRAMIMVLAGQVADQYPRDQELEILVSDLLAGREGENDKLDKTMRDAVLGISDQMLREGPTSRWPTSTAS